MISTKNNSNGRSRHVTLVRWRDKFRGFKNSIGHNDKNTKFEIMTSYLMGYAQFHYDRLAVSYQKIL